MLNVTQTTICNLALSMIGEKPINSYNDDKSELARICRTHFDITLRSVLEGGEWPCVTTEEPLSKVEYPEYAEEQKYIYAIPVKCALIARIYPKFERKYIPGGIDWDIRYLPKLSDKFIVCNYDKEVMCEYIRDEKNFSLYSAKFVKYLAAELAASMCMDITKNTEKTQYMLQYAAMLKQDAITTMFNEDGQDKLEWTDLFTASRG